MLGVLSTLMPLPAPSSTTLSTGHALSWVSIFSWRLHPTPLPSFHPRGPSGCRNPWLLPRAFLGSWRWSESQCEKCAGYFEERSETCVHCEESRGFGREQQGLSLEAAALGSVAWVSLDWLLPVSVFPSVRSSWGVTTKWKVENNFKKSWGHMENK